MQTTTNTPTTPRRSALTGAIATLAVPALAKTSPAICMGDAALITACRERVEAERQIDRLCQRRVSIATEQQTESEVTALLDSIHTIEAHIESLPLPSTPAGCRGLIRAALAAADRDNRGDIMVKGFASWAAWTVLEHLNQPRI